MDMSACYGCFINPNWNYPITHDWSGSPFREISPVPSTTTTLEEQEILHHLVEAWKKFGELSNKSDHDVSEFTYAIHLAQQKIALRVARRVDPSIWNLPE